MGHRFFRFFSVIILTGSLSANPLSTLSIVSPEFTNTNVPDIESHQININKMEAPLCTSYQIHHIGLGGYWLTLDDGSTWLIDHQDGWKLTDYIDGQRVILLHENGWTENKFALVFGPNSTAVSIQPFRAPSKEAARHRTVECWSKDYKKVKLSDGTWWAFDKNHTADPKKLSLTEGSFVMLAARIRWWTSKAAVSLIETNTWKAFDVIEEHSNS